MDEIRGTSVRGLDWSLDKIIAQVVLMYYRNEDYKSYLQSQLSEVQDEFYKIVEGWGKDADKCINKECS